MPLSLLTPVEAQRAIYIDFEGFKDESPSFMGWVWAVGRKASDDNITCIHDIHKVELHPVIDEYTPSLPGIKHYEQRDYSLSQSINDLARRAFQQDRRIVSWSTHEINKVAEAELEDELLEMFRVNYRDGKVTAKTWFKQLGEDTSNQSNKLVRYLERANYPLTEDYGLGQTTKRLKSVISGLDTRGSWSQLLSSQKTNWENLLLHNFVDCHGLRHVVKLAANTING